LFLFDTFKGMPETSPTKDHHKQGDFSNTSLEAVRKAVGHEDFVQYREGFIPETFQGLENSEIALAHVDVDIYRSVMDCCTFIFPRLSPGGFIVFDDYGVPSCPGAREAVDEFFDRRSVQPIVLPTGQALVFNGVSLSSAGSTGSTDLEPGVGGPGSAKQLRADAPLSKRKPKR
jgi:O-methyltransferase